MNENKSRGVFFESGELFAASNSARGFKSYYDRIFDRERLLHLYIIKGGPGTGKSSFMKKVGEHLERRGVAVEYYRCSFDPDSIDGILTDTGIAFIDGTAPHPAECEISGARDELIDLGAFWYAPALRERYDEISELSLGKRKAYEIAYGYLGACGEIIKIEKSSVLSALRQDKMLAAVSRLLPREVRGGGFDLIPSLTDSFGMRGRVSLDTYERHADTVYEIKDLFSSGSFFLSALIERAKQCEIPVRVSYDPIMPEYPNAVFLCNSKTAFVLRASTDAGSEGAKSINMERFLDKSLCDLQKARRKRNKRLLGELMSEAREELVRAGKYHFALERLYVASMDFTAKEAFTDSFCKMLDERYFN